MTEDLDPALQSLFAQANQEILEDKFGSEVMARIDKHKRRVLLWRIALSLVAVLITLSLQDLLLPLSQTPLLPLLTIENGLVAQLVAPLNSVGAIFTVFLLVLRIIYKKYFTVLF